MTLRRAISLVIAGALFLASSYLQVNQAGALSPRLTASSAVTFYENAFVGDSVYTDEISNTQQQLTLFANLTTAFVNVGYHFVDWNTSADGSGTTYLDGAEYDFTLGNLTLYAQWAPNTVTFYENDNGSDTTRSIESNHVSATLTLLSGMSPAFSNSGYSFAGWSTAANGAGTSYANGATYDFTLGNLVLYAQWTPNTYTVTYDADGGALAAASGVYTSGSAPLTLPSPTEQGFSFDGWYSAPTGGTLIGLAGAAFTPTSSSTLYAQWTALPLWPMSFGDNGATGTVPTLSAQQDTLITVPPGADLTRPGYSFAGWNTETDGSGTSYAAGQSVALTAPIELFAQWRALPAVSVQFSLGTSSARLAPVSTYAGAAITLPSPPARSHPGYLFAGWSTSLSGAGARWRSGSHFSVTTTTTLYAQWRSNRAAVMLPPVGPFARSSAHLPAGLIGQVRRVAVTVVSSAHRTVVLYGLARRRTTLAAAVRLAQARALAVARILRWDLRRLGDGSVRLVVARQVVGGARTDVVEVVAR